MTLVRDVSDRIGPDRLASYLADADNDPVACLQLYVWNATLGSAFLPGLGVLEVALRNAIHEKLSQKYGVSWYDDPAFRALDPKIVRSIDRAKDTIVKAGKSIIPPRMVAQLMFGFWASLLGPPYSRSLWPVLQPIFPKYTRRPNVTSQVQPLVAFRNRIAHHEVIYDRAPDVMNDRLHNALQLISPDLEAWLRHLDRVPELLARGPYPSGCRY